MAGLRQPRPRRGAADRSGCRRPAGHSHPDPVFRPRANHRWCSAAPDAMWPSSTRSTASAAARPSSASLRRAGASERHRAPVWDSAAAGAGKPPPADSLARSRKRGATAPPRTSNGLARESHARGAATSHPRPRGRHGPGRSSSRRWPSTFAESARSPEPPVTTAPLTSRTSSSPSVSITSSPRWPSAFMPDPTAADRTNDRFDAGYVRASGGGVSTLGRKISPRTARSTWCPQRTCRRSRMWRDSYVAWTDPSFLG